MDARIGTIDSTFTGADPTTVIHPVGVIHVILNVLYGDETMTTRIKSNSTYHIDQEVQVLITSPSVE